jgi:hypothetical protein
MTVKQLMSHLEKMDPYASVKIVTLAGEYGIGEVNQQSEQLVSIESDEEDDIV